ncbi:MAG: MMPL family transporter [Planctomycetota bacterium]
MDRSLASLFADDDPSLLNYQSLQQTFGGNLVVMMVYDDPELSTPAGLDRNRRWTQAARSVDGVEGILSVAKLSDAFAWLRPTAGKTGVLNRSDPLAVDFLDLFAGYTHNHQRDMAAIVAMIDPQEANLAVNGLRTLVTEMPASLNSVLVGEPVLLEDAFELIEADGRWLAILTIGLLSTVVLVTLRDWRIVLLSIACIGWSTLATRSCMVCLGFELSLVSTILVSMITVIVVAAVVHFGVALQKGHTPVDTISQLTMPITWTCLTDAAGFGSLTISNVQPVQQFGMMTAVAALAVLVSLILFAPAMLSLPVLSRDRGQRSAILPHASGIMLYPHRKPIFLWITRVALTWRRWLLVGCVLLLVATTLAVTQSPTKASFLRNFRDDSPIVIAYQRVETKLGGAGVWDVMVQTPKVITNSYLTSVRQLENRLRQIRVTDDQTLNRMVGLSKVLSLADADAVASKAPLMAFASPEIRLAGMATALPTFARALLVYERSSSRYLRIMLRSNENLSAVTKRDFMTRVESEVKAWDESTNASVASTVTGYSVLMSQLVNGLLRDQWRALGVALVSVGLLLWIATGSFASMLAALLVNTLPIMLVLSVLGQFSSGLDLGSAMIGAVSIGLSIDGSIHLLTGVSRRRNHGVRMDRAALAASTRVGAPILLATMALVIGFAGLTSSRFVPTATFGTLVSATLLISSACNLTLLPAFLTISRD